MIAVNLGLVALAASFLVALMRVATGPSLADRALAADVCLISVLGTIALLSVRLASTHFLDAVVIASLVHFISTLALARLLRSASER